MHSQTKNFEPRIVPTQQTKLHKNCIQLIPNANFMTLLKQLTYLYRSVALSGTFATYCVSKNCGSRSPTRILSECVGDFCSVLAPTSCADTPSSYSMLGCACLPIVRTMPLSESTSNRSSPPAHILPIILIKVTVTNAVVTREIKLFHNYFSLRRRLTEIILFQHMETCLKLFQNYFRSLLQFMNIFQHFSLPEIILK